jgi:alanyl-tRNA synthetase
MRSGNEVRQLFLNFFKEKEHKIVESAPVFPKDDPTLLFANAGMNQFKDIFLGTGKRDYVRAADTQKCLRVSGKHNDLEEVGHDTYHHTFFEMLGNWSFGDYFKEEAITWAWEFLTSVLKLPEEKLYVTVYEGNKDQNLEPDEESASIWLNNSSITKERVLYCSGKDNFWEMGETGPCGPCTEIHVDRGAEACDREGVEGHVCAVNGDCARYIEIWNLVFIQYNRVPGGKLEPLPAKHVDTGMGFERLVALVNGKFSNYDTDLFIPIFDEISNISGYKYGENHEIDIAFRVIADHIKAITISIADGVMPGNVGRGYVIRRLLRRGFRYGKQFLGLEKPFMTGLIPRVCDIYKDIFPEIHKRISHINQVVLAEEKAFSTTIDNGILKFDELTKELKSADIIDGEKAFILYSTYGFPKDLIAVMGLERGLILDEKGWNKAQKIHEKASDGGKKRVLLDFDIEELEGVAPTTFCGYPKEDNFLVKEVNLLKLINNKTLIVDETPFYAESGGQVGDSGTISSDSFIFKVKKTRKFGDYILHDGEVIKKEGELPSIVKAQVNSEKRYDTMANHTATHLLHWALREILGEHATQQGSSVEPDKLRFDFTHHSKLSPEDLIKIEKMINKIIGENILVQTQVMDIEEAKKTGAMAIFGEKYGDKVRVIMIGNVSKELCGGTHLLNTGAIGSFQIIEESSLSAGVRRIIAITRNHSFNKTIENRSKLQSLSQLLKTPINELEDKVLKLQEKVQSLKALGDNQTKSDLKSRKLSIIEKAKKVGEVYIIVEHLLDLDRNKASELSDMLRSGDKKIAGLFTLPDNKGGLVLLTFTSKSLNEIHAGNLLKELAPIVDGRGGGRPDFAQGGGKNILGLITLQKSAVEIMTSKVS